MKKSLKILIIGLILTAFTSTIFAQSNKTVSFTGFGGGLPSSPVVIDECSFSAPLTPVEPTKKGLYTDKEAVLITTASIVVVTGAVILVACALTGTNVSGVSETVAEDCCATLVDELIETSIEVCCEAACESCIESYCYESLLLTLIP